MCKLLSMAALLCLMALTLQSRAADDKKADKSDKDALQGTWELTSIESMGKVERLPDGEKFSFTFTGDKLKIQDSSKKEQEGTYKVVEDKKDPKQIDLIGPKHDNPKEMETMKAIYKLDGEKLTIAFPATGPKGERPGKFDDKALIMVFMKKK